ncbi:MAG: glycosyltransferase family 2 protein [Pyrinomonadaceae bacterium]
MMPKVSAIIPNYNYSRFIAEAVSSALSQTHEDIEVIVVDDGSTDDSLKVLEQFGDRIKVIVNKNSGVSTARNTGVAASTGEYVAFLDADDVWLPKKIEKQLAKFQEDREIGLVTCAMRYVRPDGTVYGLSDDGMEGWVSEELLRLARGVVVGAGSTALMRKDLFETIGGFDPRLTTSADWELSYRAARLKKVGFVREPLALYRIHGSNMHGNIAAMEHDVAIGYEKAFTNSANGPQGIRRECYGNFYLMLAGSYFRSGNYPRFLKSALKSLWYKPGHVTRYLRLRRRSAEH